MTSPPGGPLRVTPRLVVSLRSDGLQLQQTVYHQTVQLRFADLVLMSEIDAGNIGDLVATIHEIARGTCTDPEDLRRLARLLEESGRLVRGGRHEEAMPSQSEPAEPVDDEASKLEILTPLSFRLRGGRFETLDHDGNRVALLDPAELHALSQLVRHPVPNEALAVHAAEAGERTVGPLSFRKLLGRFARRGLVRPSRTSGFHWRQEFEAVVRGSQARGHPEDRVARDVFARQAALQDEREARSGRRRPKVIPVAFDMGPPAGLGSVVAFAKAFEGGRLSDFYDFRLDWVWSDDRLEAFTREPAIYLFSNYLWSHEPCIELSRRIKERSPNSITIHGGPDTPKYEADVSSYFRTFPHVDVTVRGEGELSAAETLAALTAVIGEESPDLSVLAGVAGISYRDGDRVVRTPDRARVEDLDTIPSPYLTGLFDAYISVPDLAMTLETNRGCPYGCTFCDWGSATLSRIRKFDADRVFAEIEWASMAQAKSVSIADANYGIFARDVDFARRAAELSIATGYPTGYGGNFAKNTVKYLREIINVLAEAEILTLGTLSLQSMDESTLDAIHRSNIKTEKYDALAVEMRKAKLPLMIELMMGLPGSTSESFREDLQQCIDRELPVRVNHTVLLVNSPMNDPKYLVENQIKTSSPIGPGKQAVLNSTTTYTPDDYGYMEELRVLYLMFENFGVLRLVSRYVRQETGMPEMVFYDRLRSDVTSPFEWPSLHVLLSFGSSMMAPPVSWKLMVEDLAVYLVQVLGIADDSALQSVLQAQHALLPAHGRSYPCVVALPHDVTEWHRAMLRAKDAGNRASWENQVPRLREYGPGQLTVDDPMGVTREFLGVHREINVFGVNWELESPLARARLDMQRREPRTGPLGGRTDATGSSVDEQGNVSQDNAVG